MTFFDTIKRMFGFGPDNYYGNDPDTEDDPDVAIVDDRAPSGAEADLLQAAPLPPQPQIDPAAKARIFAGVVEFINKSLPPFIQQSLNPEEQSRQISAALDKDLDNYLAEVMKNAEEYAEARLKGAADNARRDAEKLRSDMENLEHQRANMREKQLSAERRSRALTDRVNDLEGQVASLEAEREQFELENRSLLNKIKLSEIQPGVVEDLTKEVESLRAQLNERPAVPEETSAAVDTAALEAETAAKEEALQALAAEKVAAEEARKALEDARTQLETVHTELETVRTELEAARTAAEQQLADGRTQQEVAQTMYDDLQKSLVDERQARQAAEAELAEARAIVESVTELEKQMQNIGSEITRRDNRINKLKASNQRLREQLTSLQAHLDEITRNDMGLGLFAPDLQSSTEETTNSSASVLDDDFECPDWFVSEPAPGEVSPLLQPSAEFGYQEPPKKPRRPDSDAQLSLF